MSRRITLKEIADELGLSAMTVSRALNGEPNVSDKTRKRVLDKANEIGYKPNYLARSLVTQKTNTIGVVVPEITHSFFPDVIRGIEEVTQQNGYQLILSHTLEKSVREMHAIQNLESSWVDGILVSTAQDVEHHDYYHKLVQKKFPMVFFDRCIHDIGASCVSINDESSAYEITEHLIKVHNYRKIAYLGGSMRLAIARNRRNGYVKALKDYGLEVRNDWIVEGGLQEEGGAEGMKRLLELPEDLRPRAVVVVNDPAAFGAMEVLMERGIDIPGELAITGFTDDIRAKLMPVPLTTVRQPAYDVGRQSARQLLRHIEDPENTIAEDLIVNTTLMIRASCGCTIKDTGRVNILN